MLVSGGGVIQKKTARMRHDESRVSIRDTFWASHFLGPPSVPPSTIPSPSRVERPHPSGEGRGTMWVDVHA